MQINEFKPDVIVGFGILNSGIAAREARNSGMPFVYYIIDELHRLVPHGSLRRLARLIESSNMRISSSVIAINEGLRDYTIQMGASPRRTAVIRAGIDTHRFHPLIDGKEVRRNLGIADDDVVLFFMGWLYDFSGLTELAQSLVRSSGKCPNIRLVIVGKGEQLEDLRRIAESEQGKNRVFLLDWQPYERIPQMIAASDICVLPARKVGIMENIVPIKMYEYMVSGKPVITTNLSGIRREFGDGNGVLYVETADEVLDKAVSLFKSGNIRVEGMRAWRFVSGNDWQRIVTDFEQVLHHATEEH